MNLALGGLVSAPGAWEGIPNPWDVLPPSGTLGHLVWKPCVGEGGHPDPAPAGLS